MHALKKKIIYHCGPTNNGKTYNALQWFMEAKRGVLWLTKGMNLVYIAVFPFDKRRSMFYLKTMLFTGETSTDDCYEVVLIETQMIGKEVNGFAWGRALLGLKVDEIHLCEVLVISCW